MDSSSQQIDPQPSTSSIEDDASANDQQCQPKVIEFVATQSASKARGSMSPKGMEKSSDKQVRIKSTEQGEDCRIFRKKPNYEKSRCSLMGKR